MRAAVAAALDLSSPDDADIGLRRPGTTHAAIDCPDGYVCIHPEVNFVGQPWVRRAVDGSVNDLPTVIRDRGSSIRNNSTAPPGSTRSETTPVDGCA
ncbi:peptidase inhibitor family I36 protein [Streptomyces milbemycinicus]|uniref:Peptidase inhibitor family I36 protein n=1 Tax=Streptomyces milbemycinicus TaxID=476552 RepID=A0ABW8M3T6_9ACTN